MTDVTHADGMDQSENTRSTPADAVTDPTMAPMGATAGEPTADADEHVDGPGACGKEELRDEEAAAQLGDFA